MNWSNMRRLLSVCFLILASSDCGPPSASIGRDAIPTPRSAYLYGKFGIRDNTVPPQAVPTGLLFACKNQREYTIWFNGVNPYLMFEVAPSRCLLQYFLFNVRGEVRRKPVPRSFLRNVEFEADTAYYLGSFTVDIYTLSTESEDIKELRYDIIESTDQYEWTTQMMQKIYPHFARIPTEKRLIDTALLTGDDR